MTAPEMTLEEYLQSQAKPGKSKYSARAITVDGIRFDSKAEANRYVELTLLVKFEQIVHLRIHPRFIIWQKFPGEMKSHPSNMIEYEADFSYIENGVMTVEDVKGVLTPVYCLKKKMFLARYPEIKFVELKA